MTQNDPTEQALCAGYARQEEIYTQVLRLAEHLLAAAPGEGESVPLLTRIAEGLAAVGAIEADLAAAKDGWRRGGGKPGPELQQRLARIASLIQQVQVQLDRAMRSAQAQKQSLAPELDQLARQNLGHRAYAERR